MWYQPYELESLLFEEEYEENISENKEKNSNEIAEEWIKTLNKPDYFQILSELEYLILGKEKQGKQKIDLKFSFKETKKKKKPSWCSTKLNKEKDSWIVTKCTVNGTVRYNNEHKKTLFPKYQGRIKSGISSFFSQNTGYGKNKREALQKACFSFLKRIIENYDQIIKIPKLERLKESKKHLTELFVSGINRMILSYTNFFSEFL